MSTTYCVMCGKPLAQLVQYDFERSHVWLCLAPTPTYLPLRLLTTATTDYGKCLRAFESARKIAKRFDTHFIGLYNPYTGVPYAPPEIDS